MSSEELDLDESSERSIFLTVYMGDEHHPTLDELHAFVAEHAFLEPITQQEMCFNWKGGIVYVMTEFSPSGEPMAHSVHWRSLMEDELKNAAKELQEVIDEEVLQELTSAAEPSLTDKLNEIACNLLSRTSRSNPNIERSTVYVTERPSSTSGMTDSTPTSTRG